VAMLQQNVTLAIEALLVRSMYSNSENRCAPGWFSSGVESTCTVLPTYALTDCRTVITAIIKPCILSYTNIIFCGCASMPR
jgi:hypothetical protein